MVIFIKTLEKYTNTFFFLSKYAYLCKRKTIKLKRRNKNEKNIINDADGYDL